MQKELLKIDFKKLGPAMRDDVRKKARKAGSKIVYRENGNIVEEDVTTSTKKILRKDKKLITI